MIDPHICSCKRKLPLTATYTRYQSKRKGQPHMPRVEQMPKTTCITFNLHY